MIAYGRTLGGFKMRKRIWIILLSACLILNSTQTTALGAGGKIYTIESGGIQSGVVAVSDNNNVKSIQSERILDDEIDAEDTIVSEYNVEVEDAITVAHTISENAAASENGSASENAASENGSAGENAASENDSTSENATVSENDSVSENATVSENGSVSENATVSMNDFDSETDDVHGFMTEEAYQAAKEALEELASHKTIMALVYLSDYYTVRMEPVTDSAPVVRVPSGQQVHIIGFDIAKETIWYQVEVEYNGVVYRGYIEKKHLAYSDEELLAWEEAYLGKSLAYQLMADEMQSGAYSDVEQFPVSYQNALLKLKQSHPNWTFVPMNTGRDWDGCVTEQVGNYSWIYYTAQDSFKGGAVNSTWHYATKEAIAYYMDPRNFLTQNDIFQFEQNTYNKSYHTQEALQNFLNNTFMAGTIPGEGKNYAAVIYASGVDRGLSPFNLAARVVQEQGVKGTSAMISGTYAGYEGYYNYYNIQATGKTDAEVLANGLAYAKKQGWNTRIKSLNGGAGFIGTGYILKGQDTLYLQKFDLEKRSGYLHQYMQNIQAPLSEGRSMRKMYEEAGSLNSAFVFKIPVFSNMPNEVKLNKANMTLNKGAQGTLSLSNNGTKIDNMNIFWTSSDETIATVDGQGTVTALAAGEAVIMAEWEGLKATCTVTVKAPLQTIYLDKAETTIEKGRTDTLTVTYDPVDTTDSRTIKWTTSNNKVATVKDGVVTAIANGTANITATVGTKKAVCAVTVVTPLEQLVLSNHELHLEKGAARVLEVSFLPEDTTTEKAVVWSSLDDSIVSVEPLAEGMKARVTAKEAGTTAIKVVSTISNTVEAVCTVTVGSQIQSIQFTQDSMELIEGESVPVTLRVIPTSAKVSDIKISSIDSQIATVGTVSENSVGTYHVDLTAVAAGTTLLKVNAGEVSDICTVNVSPKQSEAVPEEELSKEDYILTPVTEQFYLQAYAYDIADKAVLQVQNQNKEVLDANLFDYTSDNTEIVHIDAAGVMTVNPAYVATRNKTVNVTAVLKNDASRRMVTAKVTVPATEQVKDIVIKETPEGISEAADITKLYASGMQFVLYQESKNVSGKTMNANVKWNVSDTTMASVNVNDAGAAVVTVKKPGAFKVICTAQDMLQISEEVRITTVSATPILENDTVTYNKKADVLQSEHFALIPVNGAKIQQVAIEKVFLGQDEVSDISQFRIAEHADGIYYVAFPSEEYADALAKGTYTLQLKVTTSGLALGTPEIPIEHTLQLALQVTEAAAKVNVKTATINLFYTDEISRTIEAPITANGTITAIEFQDTEGNRINEYVKAKEQDGTWYLTFTDVTGNYSAASIKGMVNVTVEGYEPISQKITLKTPVKKPAIAQNAVPALDRNFDQSTVVELQNKTLKQKISNMTIVSEDSKYLASTITANGELKISILDSTPWKNGQTYSTKLKVHAANWKYPLDINVKLRSYTVSPKVVTKAGTLTLNVSDMAKREVAYTTIGTDRENLGVLPSNEWKVSMYDKSIRKYVACDENAWLQFGYRMADKTLCVQFADKVQNGTVTVGTGTYKFRLMNVIDGYRNVYKDITVKVIHKEPTVKVKVSGKLDLINRENTTLTGKITLKNVTGKVENVTLLGTDKIRLHNDYYAVMSGTNAFRIQAKPNARLQCQSTTLPVKVRLEGGSVLYTTVTFKPVQSTPKVTVPKAQTIYKSGTVTKKSYDFAETLASGISINSIDVVSIPEGLDAEVDGNVLTVMLQDAAMKPGTYQIKVNVYFKGAQYVTGYPKGKPVTKLIQVKIK